MTLPKMETLETVIARVTENIRALGDYGKQDNPLMVATQKELESAVIRALTDTPEFVQEQRKATIDYIEEKWREGLEADGETECPYAVNVDDLAALWWHRGYQASHSIKQE